MTTLNVKQEAAAWGRIAKFLEANVNNMRRILFNPMQYVYNTARQRFKNEQDGRGNKWQPLKKKTVQAKGHDRIGVGKTHKLVRRMDDKPTFDSTGAEYGESLPDYSEYFSNKTKTSPARPLLQVTDEDEEKILTLIETEMYRIIGFTT